MHTLLCLVRHGVTEWNYEGRAQGHADIPLSAEGRRQAEAAAAVLALEPWGAIYSSPLSRAYETAQSVARRTGNTIQTDTRLMERSMGAAEGTRHAERILRWPNLPLYEIPGVEDDATLAARATEVLREIGARHRGQRVLCFAHGGLIATFLKSIVPEGARALAGNHQRNTAITRVWFDGERFWQDGPSDHQHLLDEGMEFSAEKGRLYYHLASVTWTGLPPATLDKVISHASAVESAWVGDQAVAFLRAFTDGVLYGYVDLVKVQPGYEHLVPRLVSRLAERFPDVSFTMLPPAEQALSGD